MKIVFYSQDDSIERLIQSLGGELFFARESEEVLEILEDVDEDEDCLLFLDMDIGKKKVELLNKSLVQNEWLYRIIISSEMKVKEFKKHQKGKTAAQGYVLKPLSTKVFKGILNDLEISHLISEGDLFEEGQALPDFPAEPKSVTGWSENSEVFEHEFESDESGVDFQAAEFKMNTQVRKLVDLHSVNGDRPPYEGELNDKIQHKFNQVFGEAVSIHSNEGFDEGTQESIDLRQEAQEASGGGPSLDLSLGEEATEMKVDATTDDLSFDNEDDDFILDSSEIDELEAEDEIDLESELNLSEDEVDLSEEGDELDLGLDEEIDLGEDLNFDDSAEEPAESGSLDFSDELDEMTANRELPSKEELSEFDEETGDLNIPSGDEIREGEISTGEDLAMAQDENEDFDLEIDELQEEDALEFDSPAEEGALSFSDNSEVEASELDTAESESGELDFSLGDDEELDLSEVTPEESVSEEQGDNLDDFDLGDDAVLLADDPQTSEDLDFDLGESSTGEVGVDKRESVETSTSSFSGDELNFDDDDEDDEIEKTMVINVAEAEKKNMNLEKAFEDDDADELDLGGVDLEESSSDEGDLEALVGDELSFEGEEAELEVAADTEETNPTMVMSEEMTQDLENMLDEEIVTKEFRPGAEEDELEAEDDAFDLDADETIEFSDLGEEEELEEDDQTVELAEEDIIADLESETEDELIDSERAEEEISTTPEPSETGHLSITAQEDRIPPSFNESEAIRLQATIRQLREEREGLLAEINDINREKKLTDQDNLGLKAELDEAKIEISILKKRHSNEADEMKYRLRLSDEKKLFAEEKARTLQKEFDRLQQKVRIDFNQIKQREKELESQLELVKMDSEGQVQSRDKKILDLKRNIDQLEFNMENVVIREQKSRDDKVKVEERLERIMKTLRGSIEVLEDDMDWKDDKRKS